MIDYFVELCDYYIENNDLTEKEKEKMREVLRGEKKEEEEEEEGFLKVLSRLLEWTEENIEIKG